MRKYFMLIVLLMLSLTAKAENIAQFTGGNYIFAQNGKLTFNLERNLFENKNWVFDKGRDGAKTEFEVSLPLKTKNASQFHGYEIVQLEKQDMRVVVMGGSNFAMLMRPVYSYGKQGRYIKAWLPAAAGWLIRVGGAIARNVLPPIVTKCLTNTKCKVLLSVLAAHACVLNFMWGKEGFLREIGLPDGICEQAKEEGFKKDPKTGQYTKKQPYKVTVIHGKKDTPDYKEEVFGAESEAQAMNMLRAKCNSMVGQHYEGTDLNDWSNYGLEGKIVRAEFFEAPIVCRTTANDGEDFRGPSWTAQIEKTGYVETLTMVDIANFVSKDFAKNPNPYINDKGQVGKELREKILPYAYVHKSGVGGSDNSGSKNEGKFTASSNVYIDPATGNAVQDVVTVSTVNKPSNPDLPSTGSVSGSGGAGGSGSNSSSNNSGSSGGAGGSGNSGGVSNNVTVTTNPRPDRQNDATAAESNSPNGTGSGSGSGNGAGGDASGVADASGAGGGGLDCKDKHKNVLACAEMGSINDDEENPFQLPGSQVDKSFSEESLLPSSGSCPAPKSVMIMGKNYLFSYDWVCKFADKIRMIIVGFAYLMAGYIIFSARKD